jgi:hypothetical protein
LELLLAVAGVLAVAVQYKKITTVGAVAVAEAVRRGLVILQAVLLAIPLVKDPDRLPPDQVAQLPQAVQAVLELLHPTLPFMAGPEEPEVLGHLLEQLGIRLIGLAVAPLFTPEALAALLAALLLVIQTLHGLHLELVWVQSLKR